MLYKKEVVEAFKQNGFQTVKVLMTSLLFPPDVCWFSIIRKAYKRYLTNWFVNDPKSFTKNGNLRSPGYAKVIEWLSEIWNNFDESLIAYSFKSCGIMDQKHLHTTLEKMINEGRVYQQMLVDAEAGARVSELESVQVNEREHPDSDSDEEEDDDQSNVVAMIF
jgi:hypothetical protein